MGKKRIFGALLSAAMIFTLSGCAEQPVQIQFGTGNTSGTYYTYGTAMSDILELKLEDITLDVKSTDGSAANLQLLAQNDIQLAIVQSAMAHDAYLGTGDFKNQTNKGCYRAIASLYTEPCQIVTRADSGIDSVADLQGRTISVGDKDSGVSQNAKQILLAYSLSFDLVDAQYLSFSDSAKALADGTIDAFFCTAGAPTNVISNLTRTTDISFLSLEPDKLNQLTNAYNSCIPCTIPAGTYAGQTEDIQTIGFRAILLTNRELSETQVYNLTTALFQSAEDLQFATAADALLTLENAQYGITIPYHSGAAKFYAENGMIVESQN